ncbi:cytochrome B561 [Stutzerimonas stutzeri]|uniref:Cytochrome B561 n=1 Tax=Stutzerimonas stutzeri TaxID=316 RepID=W8RUE5_STUST|nr:DUF2218 domain-containing protein [Stutzerimonas stutzeri]AHL75671.1 cytochrome B561 [Stutzerimonas stutzeri]MCQ4327749.1 DUF2218 domain-containing protein [Stutzerimonas stutzeri]
MLNSTAQIETSNPSRLIRRLCKHWSHKFEVSFDDQQGRIAFGEAQCLLTAGTGSLTAQVQTEDEAQLTRMETVVADHLQRMSADETFNFVWQR